MSEHEVPFERRERTPVQHLNNVEGTLLGVLKLVGRAREGNPEEADSNVSCAAYWLRIAATELDGLLAAKGHKSK